MDLQKIFEDLQVIRKGHFVGVSGRHLDTYVNKNALYLHPEVTFAICEELAKLVPQETEIVVGPAVGGVVLSQWVAYHLSQIKGEEVLAAYTVKEKDGEESLRVPFDLAIQGKKTLLVDDVVNTGTSIRKVLPVLVEAGANLIGVAALVNRNPKEVEPNAFGVPLTVLLEMQLNAYTEEEMPDWLREMPVVTKKNRE